MAKRDPVTTNIAKARLKLLFTQPFFGTLTMQLALVDATNAGWCPTAAVDGRNIFFNRDFFKDLDVEEIIFVLCHEVLHVALDHFGRRTHRDPEWWNMANDYVINAMLTADKIGKMPTKRIEDTNAPKDANGATAQRVGLYDAKYLGWTSEAVYDDLEKRKVKKELTMDVHIEMGDDADDGKGKKQGKGIPVKVSSEDLKKIREDAKTKVLQAAQASAGKMPASLARLLDDLLEPQINWRELLQQNIQSCITDDFTWMKPNRKHMSSGIFLPTLKKDETIDVQVAIDMSGSITNEMAADFISEIWGMMDMYADFTVGIICFDTEVYNYQVFTKQNADELLEYEPKGGGETDFNAFWNYWIQNEIEPKKAIVFTDGYPCGDWGPENYCDTIWVITEGYKTRIQPPFGQWAYYEHGKGVDEVG